MSPTQESEPSPLGAAALPALAVPSLPWVLLPPVRIHQGLLELHSAMETPLEKALTTMVTTFHKYSGREGSKLTLSRKELKELIKKELCLGEMKESSVDDLMKSLDKNSDQEIDFKEYSVFLTTLCMAYNDFFLEDNQ
ncbi:protein S100-A5 isoform X2 [Phacochoerus africanus]|uniref:protein S100-A5 isoform X2 n=2 Tax=Phacochoerus africanus TaxID=41426 RepID=UPI001FD944EC|nr:protein S100-A5 isoform X2 [Phacochoerus africanus]